MIWIAGLDGGDFENWVFERIRLPAGMCLLAQSPVR